jgi:parvulin-like peptidyl-prolyl isomerase
MKRLLREPLLHFLLLGAVIFAVFAVVSADDNEARDAIVVTQGRIESLALNFARAWRRPATAQELDGLIGDYVREEIAVREATALALDRDDSVIRRLLRQKLEFVADNLVAQAEPSEEQLQRYLREHAERFRSEPNISFSHVYLDPQRRGEALASEAAQLREQLNSATVEVSTAGDVTSLEAEFTAVPPSAIAQIFGEPFAAALLALDTGRWSAPIASAYGTHLVYVSASEPGADPALQQVREVVRREWMNARRKAAIDQFYLQLQQRYRVSIERADPAIGADTLADLRP